MEEPKALTDIVEHKLSSLQKFIPANTSASCEVEFEKVSDKQHGRIYRIEVNLTINGALNRAEATEESFEQAIDAVRSELENELRKVKGKHEAIVRRAGRKLKSLFSKTTE
jgi:ribosomal subunit interface protein